MLHQRVSKMNIKKLLVKIIEEDVVDIEIEDNKGNTIAMLEDLDIADVDYNENGIVIRLQMNKEGDY